MFTKRELTMLISLVIARVEQNEKYVKDYGPLLEKLFDMEEK